MKSTTQLCSALAASAVLALNAGSADAGLISHYTFDTVDTGTTPDSVGSAFATLGSETSITTTGAKVGAGALDLTDDGSTAGGAVTSNTFAWATDARTIAYWWKADSPNTDVLRGTYISMGTDAAGERFDIREAGSTTLRVEVAGAGETTNPAIDDGNWHFIVVTVPDDAEFQDVAWYVDGSTTDLNTSTSTQDIATATSAIIFGDSVIGTATDRTPNGFLDDFQLYDEVLTTEQISFLYNNPGSVIPEPGSLALMALGGLCILRRRRG